MSEDGPDARRIGRGLRSRHGRHASVFVVAITDADEVVLVQLDRHTTGPAGGALVAPMANNLWSRPSANSRGERVSGTAVARDQRMNALNGICRAPEVVFLATGLSRAEAHGAQEEESARCAPKCPARGDGDGPDR